MLNLTRLTKAIGQRSPLVVWAATACGLLFQFIVFAAIAFDSYRHTVASNFEVAENIASLIERDIARNLELYDLSLQSVVRNVRDPEVMALPPRLKQIAAFDSASTAPGLGAMVVLDKNGTIILDSVQAPVRAGNFADREYFTFQRDTPRPDGLYVSRPFEARLQKNLWSVSVSRRINADDGSFAGIVSGTLKLDFIQQRMASAALGKNGMASLLRRDGIVFAQSLAGNPNVGADWRRAEVFKRLDKSASGTYFGSGSIDKVPRLYAYRSVPGFALVVVAGIAQEDVLAPWWSRVQLIAGVFAAMVASVILLVSMFARELRRRIVAEQGQAVLARRDKLSQLANRLGFDEALAKEWRRAARNRQSLSLVMIDVDHFKQFNDRYGHTEGDKVLTAIGRAIGSAVCRPADVAARYGGEEFAVLLPETDVDGAMCIAELIRILVETLGITHEFSDCGVVTLSLGVTTVMPNKDLSPQSFVVEADRALYEAKSGGRNRVCLSRTARKVGTHALELVSA